MSTTTTRFFKVNATTRYIEQITVGSVVLPGYEFIEQAADKSTVTVGWSYGTDGVFSDTSAAYKAAKAAKSAPAAPSTSTTETTGSTT